MSIALTDFKIAICEIGIAKIFQHLSDKEGKKKHYGY